LLQQVVMASFPIYMGLAIVIEYTEVISQKSGESSQDFSCIGF